MRRPSAKLPIVATVVCFVPFLIALSVRLGFVRQEWPVLESKLLAAICFSVVVWAIYGLISACAKR